MRHAPPGAAWRRLESLRPAFAEAVITSGSGLACKRRPSQEAPCRMM
jgi:hypothetical protein